MTPFRLRRSAFQRRHVRVIRVTTSLEKTAFNGFCQCSWMNLLSAQNAPLWEEKPGQAFVHLVPRAGVHPSRAKASRVGNGQPSRGLARANNSTSSPSSRDCKSFGANLDECHMTLFYQWSLPIWEFVCPLLPCVSSVSAHGSSLVLLLRYELSLQQSLFFQEGFAFLGQLPQVKKKVWSYMVVWAAQQRILLASLGEVGSLQN